MIISKIRLQNWMNIRECDLDFIQGINIIQGKVGEGKSSVFAAIAYALGDYKRGDSWKDYVTTGEKVFEIQLDCLLGNTPDTRMELYYRGDIGKGSVYKEIKYNNETKTGEEIPIFLSQHLDQQMLNSVIFNLQGGVPLSQMTPSERRDIFKRIFNSDFSSIIDKLRDAIKDKQKTEDTLEATIKVLQNKEYTLFRIIPVDDSELLKLQEELKQAHLSETVYLRLAQRTDKLNQLNSYQHKKENLEASRKEYLEQVEILQHRLDTVKALQVRDSTKLSTNTLDYEKAKIELQSLRDKVEEETDIGLDSIHELENEILNLNNSIIETKTHINITQHHLETHKKGICESCGQQCDVSKIPEFENLIKQYTEELTEYQEQVKVCKGKISDINKAIISYTETIKDSEKNLMELNQGIMLLTSTIKGYTTEITTITTTTLPNYERTLVDCETHIGEETVAIASIQKWLLDNPEPEQVESRNANDIQQNINSLQERIQQNITKKEMNDRVLQDKEKDIQTIANLNIQMNDLKKELDDLQSINQIYTSDFPNFINLRACKILESYMNGFFLSTKDKFQIALQSDKKGVSFYYKSGEEKDWRNLKMVSGYESALSTLGFKVGVAVSFGSPFIILDEPEANADPEAAEKLFETIGDITQFKQIFLISHKKDLMEKLLYEKKAKGYHVNKGVFTLMEV